MNDRRTEDLSGAFVPGERYSVKTEPTGVLIHDPQSRPVAQLPLAPGGEASTRAGRWTIAVERERARWLVVARDPTTGVPVGCAYPRWLPSAYELWVAPENTYRLRPNPLTGRWTLRKHRDRIARFDLSGSQTIEIAEAIVADPQLALVTVLACETIRYDGQIPDVPGAAAGP